MCVLASGTWTATNFNLSLLDHWTSFQNSGLSNWQKIHGIVTALFSTLQRKSIKLITEAYESVLYQLSSLFITLIMLATAD